MADWTNERIEAGLAAAVEHSVPDLYGRLAGVELPPAREEALPRPAPRRHTARRAALGLCACLALVCSLGLYSFFRAAAVIGIDVNPSIELTANRYDRVLEVRPLNADARAVLGDMDLKYLDLDVAVNALIGSMVRSGYLTGEGGAVLVSVTGGSEDYNVRLQKQVAGDIERALSVSGGSASVFTQNAAEPPAPPAVPTPSAPPPAATASPAPPERPPAPQTPQTPQTPPPGKTPPPAAVQTQPPARPEASTARQRAQQNGISYGKQVFIDRLRVADPGLDEGALAQLSIGELAALVEQRGIDLRGIVDYDGDDSTRENIDDFIDDVDEDHDDRSGGRDDDDRDDDDDDEDDDDLDYDDDDDDDDDEDDD